MCSGTCVCQQHRWPLYSIAQWPSISFAPFSYIDSTSAFEKIYSPADSQMIHNFLNAIDFSTNTDPVISQRSYTDAVILRKTINSIHSKDKAGLHERTVWSYTGTASGVFLSFPGSNSGNAYDPTRRPWYQKAVGLRKRWQFTISNPYLDYTSGGLMNTFSSVIFDLPIPGMNTSDKVWGVVGWDMLYEDMNIWISTVTGCALQSATDNAYTHKTTDKPICFLLDESGLLLTHGDFMMTLKDAQKYQNLTDETSAWPIDSVFLGLKEPALANALITSGFLVPKSAPSITNDAILHWFDVNETSISESGVLSGTINDCRCYRSAETNWFLSHISGSNAFLLVVENFQYTVQGATRTGNCLPISSMPIENIQMSSCKAANFGYSSSKGTLPCWNIPYSFSEIEFIRPTDSKSSSGNGKCAEIHYPSFNTAIGIGLSAASGFLLFLTGCCFVTTIYHRKTFILKVSSVLFCLLMEFGCMLGYVTVFLYIAQPSREICVCRIWFVNFAFVFMLGPLLVKTWRIHRIFNNPRMRKIKLTNRKIVLYFLVIFLAFFTFVLAFSLSANIHSSIQVDAFDVTILYLKCSSRDANWAVANISLVMFVTLGGVFLCVETRNVKAEFNESSQIAMAIYIFFLTGVLILPLLFFLQVEPQVQTVLICIGILSTCTFTWVAIMTPKFLKLKWTAADFQANIEGSCLFSVSQQPDATTAQQLRFSASSRESACQLIPQQRKDQYKGHRMRVVSST